MGKYGRVEAAEGRYPQPLSRCGRKGALCLWGAGCENASIESSFHPPQGIHNNHFAYESIKLGFQGLRPWPGVVRGRGRPLTARRAGAGSERGAAEGAEAAESIAASPHAMMPTASACCARLAA
jgi:hypothetical protein